MLERIGNCRVLEEVASGGMAVVYKAIQDNLNRTVAIKALKTAVATDEQLVKRFEREAQSLANLQHENIIHVYDFLEERGALFIVMEYVPGIDLYDLLDQCGRLPYDVAAIIAMQVARALDYIHYRAIVHRDIKPANIMVSREGGVKVMDFGIARDRTYEDDLTQTGTGIGTPSYMSPEQILGDHLDARSDIFSLGIVLFQMVTGRKPFIEDEQHSVMHKIRLEKPPKPRKLNPELPRELERIIEKCLEKEPKSRYRSAQALVMALERFLDRHVDMNYNSRLVLFLRREDIITRLEADEYLNPAHLGEQALTQPALLARNTVRRGLIVQSAILALMFFVVGLIHLAPVGKEVPGASGPYHAATAYIKVVANPWGEVFVDDEHVATTPLAEPFALEAGIHKLVIKNSYFDADERFVDLNPNTPDDPTIIRIDFEEAAKRPQFEDDGGKGGP